MNEVAWGVLGAGGIALRRTIPEGIIPAENARLAAVYAPQSGPAVAERFGVRACASESELLASDVQAVYIATPTHLHARQAISAAEAGKHVLCEKPLATNVSEAQRIADACRGASVCLGVGFMMRFHALHRAAQQIVRDGRIGQPVYARAQLSCWYPPMTGAWRQDRVLGGGGCLADLGVHCMDLLEWLLGPAAALSCTTSHATHRYAVEDTAIVVLDHDSRVRSVVDVSFAVPDAAARSRLEIYGTSGSLIAEHTIGQSGAGQLRLFSTRAVGYDAAQDLRGEEGQPIAATPANPYQAMIEDFSSAVIENRSPTVDGDTGLRSQRVLEACYRSAANRERATV